MFTQTVSKVFFSSLHLQWRFKFLEGESDHLAQKSLFYQNTTNKQSWKLSKIKFWPSSPLYKVFDSISSNIDEVLSINLSANVFVFEDVNVHHKHWLTYSGGTDRPGELCYNLSYSLLISQMTLLIYPETLKYWVGVQRGQSNLMGRRCLFSLGWRPF